MCGNCFVELVKLSEKISKRKGYDKLNIFYVFNTFNAGLMKYYLDDKFHYIDSLFLDEKSFLLKNEIVDEKKFPSFIFLSGSSLKFKGRIDSEAFKFRLINGID
jgi:hypothetical protein